jgi:hypothetical protein
MQHARIDITQGLDGEAVVLACFDLGSEEIGASAYAVKTVAGERYRNHEMSVDDVLELRELTALTDELDDHVQAQGIRTLVMRPSRLNAWRDALTHFVESRDDDRKSLPLVRELLWPLGDLCADAMRAALNASTPHPN